MTVQVQDQNNGGNLNQANQGEAGSSPSKPLSAEARADAEIFDSAFKKQLLHDLYAVRKVINARFARLETIPQSIAAAISFATAGEISNVLKALSPVAATIETAVRSYLKVGDDIHLKKKKEGHDSSKGKFDEAGAQDYISAKRKELEAFLPVFVGIAERITKAKSDYAKMKETVATSGDDSKVMKKEAAPDLAKFHLPASSLYSVSARISDIGMILQKDAVLLIFGSIEGLDAPLVYKATVLGHNVKRDIVRVSIEYPEAALKAGRKNGEIKDLSIMKLLKKAEGDQVRLDLSI